MQKNLWNKFRESSLKFGDQVAIQYKKNGRWEDVSFRRLRRNAESLSAFLAEESINKNDTVAISVENRPEWTMIFFAVISRGAVIVPINPRFGPEEVRNILYGSGCKIAFVGSDSFLLKEESRDKFSFIKKVISVESDVFRLALEKEPISIPLSVIEEDHTACNLYTSGTTAEPKGIMLSHGNLLANSNALSRRADLVKQEDGFTAALPLYDAYPLTCTMLLPLFYGGRVIFPGSMCPEEIMAAMQEKNPANFIGVPQVFRMFHAEIAEKLNSISFIFKPFFWAIVELLYGIRKMTGINLSRHLFRKAHRKLGRSMRFFISGGVKLDENVGRDLVKFGFTILEGYGLTETSPVLTLNPFKKPKIGSVGLPLPDVEVKLLNKNKEGVGEIIARGANIMKGYCLGAEMTSSVIKDGWFHTGDLGFIDKDGYLYLKGRSKDVIIFDSGLNVYPGEIEDEYSREAPIREMCVFEGCPERNMKSQFLKAAVVPDPEFFKEYNGDIETIGKVLGEKFEKVSRRLSDYKRINDFFVTFSALPRTRTGKIKRHEVKEMYDGRSGHDII